MKEVSFRASYTWNIGGSAGGKDAREYAGYGECAEYEKHGICAKHGEYAEYGEYMGYEEYAELLPCISQEA